MKTLLAKSRLNKINRTLYGRNVQAVFYKVTPSDGEVEIGSITGGFSVIREQRGPGQDGTGVKMVLATDTEIDRDQLHVGGAVALTINGQTLRYSIDELLPQQQIGAGYVLRLIPLTGATT